MKNQSFLIRFNFLVNYLNTSVAFRRLDSFYLCFVQVASLFLIAISYINFDLNYRVIKACAEFLVTFYKRI
jgi:hypothetical protein